MESAETFNSNDLTIRQRFARLSDCFHFNNLSSFIFHLQPYLRSTHWTCHRLSMEASIYWIRVFTLTIGAHWKQRHCGFRAIIWNVFDDSEAGSAVCTVDEWVTVAAVVGVEQLTQTIRTNGNIWRDRLERALHSFRVENFQRMKSVYGLERCGKFIDA